MIPILLSAFILGFSGSFHCVGMCGPIAMTLPSNTEIEKWKTISLYLIGKTITYAILGLIFGLFGRQLMIAGLQQALSIASGVLLLIIVVMMLLNARQLHQNIFTRWTSAKLLPLFGHISKHSGSTHSFYLGLLNGLLPCGLVYLGLIGSLATGAAISGMAFMFFFGLGTMPVMLSFLIMAKQFSFNFRNRLNRLSPIFISILAILLIIRGLNLDIPFISPSSQHLSTNSNTTVVECR